MLGTQLRSVAAQAMSISGINNLARQLSGNKPMWLNRLYQTSSEIYRNASGKQYRTNLSAFAHQAHDAVPCQ